MPALVLGVKLQTEGMGSQSWGEGGGEEGVGGVERSSNHTPSLSRDQQVQCNRQDAAGVSCLFPVSHSAVCPSKHLD